jgi:cytochrome c biogenesis protein CcdA
MEVNFIIAFISGLIIGASPCILLMLSSFGTSVLLIEKKRKFAEICLGLIGGLIFGYIVISIIFLYFSYLFKILSFIKYILALLLIVIGIWQILESRKEDSTIFSTPEKVKGLLKDYIEKQSGLYAFLVGNIFVLIKLPCFGGIYLALIFSLHQNPLLFAFIFVYFIGMIIPIILVLLALRLGLESDTVNEFRLQHRAKLRALAGAVLILLAIVLLLWNDIESLIFSYF